jgi:hypothetical protein
MPQKINVAKTNLKDLDTDDVSAQHGPFQVLSATELADLRKGDPKAVQTLRENIQKRLKKIDLEKYKETEKADDVTHTARAMEKAGDVLSAAEVHGANPEGLGTATAQIMDKMSEPTQMAHMATGLDKMSAKRRGEFVGTALKGLPAEERPAATAAGLKQMSDEELKQLPPELVTRILKAHQPPPASPEHTGLGEPD